MPFLVPAGAFPVPLPTPIPFWDPAPTLGGDALLSDQVAIQFGEGPTFATNIWDTVFLNGKQLPGICKIRAQQRLQIDKKKPAGVDGLTLTAQGTLPGPVEIEIMLWTADQWSVFQTMAREIWIKPTAKGKANAITVSAPGSDLWGINAVAIEGVSVPEWGPIPQSVIIKLVCQQFFPPDGKTKTHTPKAAGKVVVDKKVDRPANKGGESPGKTDTGPTGAKRT